MILPRLMLITNRHQMRPAFEPALEAALNGGVRLIQLREKDATGREVFELALIAQRLCERYGARLLISSRADIARAVYAAGVHLPENDLPPHEARHSLSAHALCGVSVHSVEAARRAADQGADYLVFGSVFSTASHPGTAPAGLQLLHQVVQSTSLPVFAVGGIDATSANACLEVGAHGVAVISAIWAMENIEAAVRSFILKFNGPDFAT